MAKNSISDYDTTAANNTDIQSVDVSEGCPASGINNAIREMMADTADAFTQGTPIALDQTNNRVGLGNTAPETILHATDSSAIIRLTSDANGTSGVDFGDSADTNIGRVLYDNSDNSMRFTTNASERLRIDSSGNVGVGTTSPSSKLHVDNGSTHADVIVKGGDATTNFSGGSLLLANPGMATNYGGTYLYHHKAGGSGNTNAAFNISQRTATGTYVSNVWNVDYENSVQAFYVPNGGVSGLSVFQINASGNNSFRANNAGVISTFNNINTSNPDGIDVAFTGAAPDNNSRYFYRGRDTAINRYYVYSDGDVQNHDNSYGGTSDLKLKQQVTDAASQWDDIKALQVRKFKFNSDVTEHGDSDALWRLGVVAQEVEAAGMTGLIKNNPDYGADQFDEETQQWVAGEELGTVTKAVKYSVLYMKAVKALQEAMTRIETLETEMTALKARVTALEA
jgi:hypothetical protein